MELISFRSSVPSVIVTFEFLNQCHWKKSLIFFSLYSGIWNNYCFGYNHLEADVQIWLNTALWIPFGSIVFCVFQKEIISIVTTYSLPFLSSPVSFLFVFFSSLPQASPLFLPLSFFLFPHPHSFFSFLSPFKGTLAPTFYFLVL